MWGTFASLSLMAVNCSWGCRVFRCSASIPSTRGTPAGRVLHGILAAILLGLTTAPATPASALGLVASYALDEGSGTTTADLSGSGYNGTLTNGPTWVTGK